MRESRLKNQFINRRELHNLLVQEENSLDKRMDQITHTVTDMEAEIGFSLKESAVNSDPQGDSFAAVQEKIAREVAKKLEEVQRHPVLPVREKMSLGSSFLNWLDDICR